MRYKKTVSKAFDIFVGNNKNQIMVIIKLFKLHKQFRKESIFIG